MLLGRGPIDDRNVVVIGYVTGVVSHRGATGTRIAY
jgi:hypothetical protein